MNKKIQILLILSIVVIAGVVLFDSLSTRVDKRPDNPFEYNIDEYRVIDQELITYKEIRQIETGDPDPRAITYADGKVFLLSHNHVRVITEDGRELLKKNIDPDARAITVSKQGNILVAYENYLVSFNGNLEELSRSEEMGDETIFTSVAISGNSVFVADAGKKEVTVFNDQLEFVSGFKGESGVSVLHGFILPSLHFHMSVNADDELWVVNPGMHRIQNYAQSGRIRGDWGKPSFDLDGFSGCCNPSYFAFLSDGRFVTSEKGLVRVKIHKESGELESVVAPPDKFPNGEKAPALAVDEKDNIWLLDFDKKILRLFEPV